MPAPTKPAMAATLRPATASRLSQQDLLAAMLRHYFSLPENAPLSRFQKGIKEITTLEILLGNSIASTVLVATATQFYAETKQCPFCGAKNQLHLPDAPITPTPHTCP